ncbi:NmrA domain-containing protein [Fusarium falciforme]|uniref:NmrA domain-containing protein n=1 Tax=Fusarium falciforme TaxID=195108 RepID=UPI0023018DEC|nr:NmrA domain-containing protein [Fusarium falciforme]WAO87061.1 NmrA domain-containing protein [Fusarium falciforme]
MSRQIKNVALAGASGSLGSVILHTLVRTGGFNVTVLSRRALSDVPSGVAVQVVDFGSASALTEALKDQDALIDATSATDPSVAIRLTDAAVVARVYRMIPSEFGVDPANAKARGLAVFQGKAKALEHIQKLADDGKITWTAISNNSFLDWGLRTKFLSIDLENKSISYLNGGNTVVPNTTVASVATAVANVLSKPQETRNRICYICNRQMTQRELANLAKKALGDQGWEEEDLDMNQVFEKAMAQLQAGQVDWQVMGDIVRYSISTLGYVNRLEKTDNELLGVEEMSDEEVIALMKEIANEKTSA